MGDEICERGIRDNALSHGTRMILGLFRQPRQTCARLRNRQQLQETVLLHGNGVEQNVFETPRVVGMRGINLWPATKRRVTSFLSDLSRPSRMSRAFIQSSSIASSNHHEDNGEEIRRGRERETEARLWKLLRFWSTNANSLAPVESWRSSALADWLSFNKAPVFVSPTLHPSVA